MPLYDFYPSIESFLDTVGQEDHRPGRRQPQPGAVRHQAAPGPVPDPLRRRDEGQRRQPGHALHRPDRRRPPGPAAADRGEPRPAGKGNAHQPQRRQLLLPHQRRAGHQPGDQERRPARAARRPSCWARSSSRTCSRDNGSTASRANKMDFDVQPPLRPASQSATKGRGTCSSRSSRRWPTTTTSTRRRKCILESTAEGGCVLIRLGNDERLGRELRTYLQTEKYLLNEERRHAARVDQADSPGLRRREPPAAGAADRRCSARCWPRPTTSSPASR